MLVSYSTLASRVFWAAAQKRRCLHCSTRHQQEGSQRNHAFEELFARHAGKSQSCDGLLKHAIGAAPLDPHRCREDCRHHRQRHQRRVRERRERQAAAKTGPPPTVNV